MIPSNKGKRLPPEPLSADEVRGLIGACSKTAATGVRNKALLVVLYRGGLRISEALGLLPKDLDPAAGTLRVMRGKNNKSRLIGLDAGAWGILQVWLERRSQLGFGGRTRVFCTLDGEPLKTTYCRTMVRRLGQKAGIQKRVHLHGLRHSCAFELANERTPLHMIQGLLGHSNLSTTSRYISHLAPVAIVETMRSREWSL